MIKTNVPQLRFSGFSGEWKQEKFNNFVKRISETSSSNQYKKIEFSDIDSGILKNKLRNNDSKGIKFLKKDVLFGKLRPYLKNWYYCNFDGIAIGDFWVYRAKKDYSNSTFIYYLIQTEKYNLVANYTTGTKMPRSDWNIVSNTLFGLPSFNEQQKIGDFFAKQDKLIELQTQKVDQLKKLKRGYLQKMFPQEGETVPRLRFSGFSGEWKEVTLGECYSINTGKSKYFINDNGKYAIAGSKGIIGYDSDYDYSGSFVMVSRVGEAGSMYELDGKLKITDNTIFIQTNYNKYLSGLLTNRNINKLSQGSGRRIIKSSDLKRMKINSANYSEQKKINDCIILIDKILELELKKLNELKRQKKSYLQKMFI